MKTADLIGPRRERLRPPELVIAEAVEVIDARMQSGLAYRGRDLAELKSEMAGACRAYYALAACSRRRNLDPALRAECLELLYRLRSLLEARIIGAFAYVEDISSVEKAAFTNSFFGVSKKQGISIRYPLTTCVPTKLCGGRCYAHDGRDRELHLIFRACLNYYVGTVWESNSANRDAVERRLKPIIEYGVRMAIEDAALARTERGFTRSPRIRFSHIGEMVATPNFSNWLAGEIKKSNSEIECIVYSRNPAASLYDPDLFVVNFTLDSVSDNRRRFAPQNARIVSSAWDGAVSSEVDINFLEHHVEKVESAQGIGFVCPVTANHAESPSCDSAGCDRCFRPMTFRENQ